VSGPTGRKGYHRFFKKKKGREGFPNKKNILKKKSKQKKTFLKQKMQTCCLALRAGRDFLSMVRSSGSNNCSIRRIEPWLDPPDRTIVGSKGSNHGWQKKRTFFCLHFLLCLALRAGRDTPPFKNLFFVCMDRKEGPRQQPPFYIFVLVLRIP